MHCRSPTLPVLIAGAFSLACTAEPRSGLEPPAFDPNDPFVDTVAVVASIPGSPIPGLSRDQRQLFQEGMGVFAQPFTPATGLGPLFNANACGECHEDPVPGGPGDEVEVHATAFHAGSCQFLETHGGPVVQQDATPELQALGILREPIPEGATDTGLRRSPPVFGLGLLDAVSDRTIIALSRIRHQDGVHGRPAILPSGRVGRFGRKANTASLTEFNAGAFFAEMGVTNRLHPVEGTIAGQPLPPGVDLLTPEPEIDDAAFRAADLFVRFLAPVRPERQTDQTRQGRWLFREINCTSCHIPVLVTGFSRTEALRFKRIRAYSDLLLHDMGEAEADICDGVATPSEFRTQPLMGIRFQEGYMHDGAAETIGDAIQRHGGEAATIRDRFFNLIPSDQAALVAFVLTL